MNGNYYLLTVYQQRIWNLQKEIFRCSCLVPEASPSCAADVDPQVINDELGPDSIYVGSQYGESGFKKILFIGMNPNMQPNTFGSPRSIETVLRHFDQIDDPTDVFRYLAEGYQENDVNYEGYANWDLFHNLQWSISRVFKEFFPTYPDILYRFALTNATLCRGNRSSGNPTNQMRNNCIQQQWLKRTIDILSPDVVFTFSVRTFETISVENGIVNERVNFDHPCNFACKIYLNNTSALLINIPHLTSPKFSTWKTKMPIMYRRLFNFNPNECILKKLYRKLVQSDKFILKKILGKISDIFENEL